MQILLLGILQCQSATSVWDSKRNFARILVAVISFLPATLIAIEVNTDAILAAAGRIALVAVLAVVAVALIQRLVTPVVRVAIREQMANQPEIEVSKRIATLSDVIYRTTAVVIALIALVTILPEFGVNAGPLIAGLGLVGLAVGFGAQNAVRDLINGLEILVENQFGKGDFIRLRTTTGGSISGSVQDINLRRTVLRDFDGAVHFISHGSVEVASNLTRGFSRISFNVVVAYDTDIDRVSAVIDRVGRELAADPEFAGRLRQPPQAGGIDRVNETSIEVKVTGATEPGEQWAATTELRRRLKAAFDAEGIRARDAAPPP
jgi:moderate conductance mechanosensitive channel